MTDPGKINPYQFAAIVTILVLVASASNWSSREVSAAPLQYVSDTLSDSDLGVFATHTIQWHNATSVQPLQTIRITFDPFTDAFDGVQNANTGNLNVTGFTLTGTCTGAPSEATLTTSTASGDESIIFTMCAGDSIAASTTVTVVVLNPVLSNPTSTGAYAVRIGGTQEDSGETRVAVIDDVILTASVDTSFTFTIFGVTSTFTLGNGATTTATSTPTALAFGTLPVNGAVTLAQRLQVSTNAKNGFAVTIQEDQNPTNFTGDDIDLFANGAADPTPVIWRAPSSTVGLEATYGHIGVTSDDQDLAGGEFGATSTPLFAGNFQATTTRAVFAHSGPADGSTANAGMAHVGFRIQIGLLQEPGALYTNVLTYVATPVF